MPNESKPCLQPHGPMACGGCDLCPNCSTTGQWHGDCGLPLEYWKSIGYRLVGPAEVAVLEAMANMQVADLEYLVSDDYYAPGFTEDVAMAELARRKAGE